MPFQITTILLTIFPVLCTLHPYDYSVTTSLYFLIPSPFSLIHPPSTPLATVKMLSVSMSLFLFFLFNYFVIYFPHLSEIIWHLSFSDLFYWAQYPLGPSMSMQMARFHSFLWLSHISFVYMHHFFTRSSLDGHWGCCHGLAIVNNAAMNIWTYKSFQFRVFYFFR